MGYLSDNIDNDENGRRVLMRISDITLTARWLYLDGENKAWAIAFLQELDRCQYLYNGYAGSNYWVNRFYPDSVRNTPLSGLLTENKPRHCVHCNPQAFKKYVLDSLTRLAPEFHPPCDHCQSTGWLSH